MDIDASTVWWIAAAVAVAAELATGTFYLLMIALGLAAGGLAASLGASWVGQLLGAALVGGGAVAAWTTLRAHRPPPVPANANPDVLSDIGRQVHVTRWAADGTARVHYRGAEWSARWQGDGPPPGAGHYTIRSIDGNQLVVSS
ncbi:MAG: NfeD family protein [Burkholderiales bacterium]|nr:NfeD family protein [Burkholderiales bacterium]